MDEFKGARVEVTDTIGDLIKVRELAEDVVSAYQRGGTGPYNQSGRVAFDHAVKALARALRDVNVPKEVTR